ncbi:bifunctional phosphopantothenoylcysteine decarboxylase/phosphopantothenate synthase, partial [Avibacterium paragallinarum]
LETDRPFVVGFAAETQHLAQYAQDKLVRKNLDLICANDVSNGQGFNAEYNQLHLFWRDGNVQLPLTHKKDLAVQLVQHIVEQHQRHLQTRLHKE